MTTYNDSLSEYVARTFASEDETLAQIRRSIAERGLPPIMISPEEAAFLHFLVVATGARRAVEVGTLGGYSGTWIARGLGSAGKLFTLEVDPGHAKVARENFRAAGLVDRVEVLEGNAEAVLPSLSDEGPFDFVFIDADKKGYPHYLDWTLANLRTGGVVAAHNAFARGRIAQKTDDEAVAALQQFNLQLAEDPRLVSTIFPAGDGVAVAVLTEGT
jgi:predicted O-methyltransferase YrrM